MEKLDFHALPRRQLQALCKKHGIPANGTNFSMADALRNIEQQETEKHSAVKEHLKDGEQTVKNVTGSDKLIKSSVDCAISEKEVEGVLEIIPTDAHTKCARKVSGRTSTRRGCKEAEIQAVQPKKTETPPKENKVETEAKICIPAPTNPSLQMAAEVAYDEADQKNEIRKTRGRSQTNAKCVELEENAKAQLEKVRTEAKSSISVSEVIVHPKTVEVLDMVDSEKHKCLRELRGKASYRKPDSEASRELKSSKQEEDSDAPKNARIDHQDTLLDNFYPAKLVKADHIELENRSDKKPREMSCRNRAGKGESESIKSKNDGETPGMSEDIEPEVDHSFSSHLMTEEVLEPIRAESGNQKCQKKLRGKSCQKFASDVQRETKPMKPTAGSEVAVLEENQRTEDKDNGIQPVAEHFNPQVGGETALVELENKCERKVRGRSGARRACKAELEVAPSQARINAEALSKKGNVKPEANHSLFAHQTPSKMFQHQSENNECQHKKPRGEEEHTTLIEGSLVAALKEETRIADVCNQQNIEVSDNAKLEKEKNEKKLTGKLGKERASKAKPLSVSCKLKENAETFVLQENVEPAANHTLSARKTPLQTVEPVHVKSENKICQRELSENSCRQRDGEAQRKVKVELAFAKQKHCKEAPHKAEESEKEAEENLHLNSEKNCRRKLRGRASSKVGGKGEVESKPIKVEEDAEVSVVSQLEAEKDPRDKASNSRKVTIPICVQSENKNSQRQLRGRESSKRDSEGLVEEEWADVNPKDCSEASVKEEKFGTAAEEIVVAEEVAALQKSVETEVEVTKKGQVKNLRGRACLQLASEAEAESKCVKVEEDPKAVAMQDIAEIDIKESLFVITAQQNNVQADHVKANNGKGGRRRRVASTKPGNKEETVIQSAKTKQDQNAFHKEEKVGTEAEFSNATVITPSEETAEASEKPTKDLLRVEAEDVSSVSTLDTSNEGCVRKPKVRPSRRASLANQTAAKVICSETLRIQARRSVRNNRSSVDIDINQRRAPINFSNRSEAGGSDVNSNLSTLHESPALHAESPSSETTEHSCHVSEASLYHIGVQIVSSPGKGENCAQSMSAKKQAAGTRKQRNERFDRDKMVSMSSSKRNLGKKDLEELDNASDIMNDSPEEMTLSMKNHSSRGGTPNEETTIACGGENLVLEVNQRADSLSRKALKKDEKFVEEVSMSEPDSTTGSKASISVHKKSGEVSGKNANAFKSDVSTSVLDGQDLSPRSTYSTITGERQCAASQLQLEFESSERKDCEKSKRLQGAHESNQLGCWEEKLDEEEGASSLKGPGGPGDCIVETSAQDEKELQVYHETHQMHLTEDIEDDDVIFDEYLQSISDMPTSESQFEMPLQNSEELLQETLALGTWEQHNASTAAVTKDYLHMDSAAISHKETLKSSLNHRQEEAVADTYLANHLEEEVCFSSSEEKMPKNCEAQALRSYNEAAACESYLQLDEPQNQPDKLTPINEFQSDRATDIQIRLFGGADNAMEEVCCCDEANVENDRETQTLCSLCIKEESCESRLPFDEEEVQTKKLLLIDQFQTVETDFTPAGQLEDENNVMEEVFSEPKMEEGETEALYSSFVEVQTSKSYLLLDKVEAQSENLLSVDDLETGLCGGSEIASKWQAPEISSELHFIMEGGASLTAERSFRLFQVSSHQGKEEGYMLEQQDALVTKEAQLAEILPFEWADSGDEHIDVKRAVLSDLDDVEVGGNSLASTDDIKEVPLVCNKTNSEGIPETVKQMLQSPQLSLRTRIDITPEAILDLNAELLQSTVDSIFCSEAEAFMNGEGKLSETGVLLASFREVQQQEASKLGEEGIQDLNGNLFEGRIWASDHLGDCQKELVDLQQINANNNLFQPEEIEDEKDCEDATSIDFDGTSSSLAQEDMPEPRNSITIAEATMNPPSHMEVVSEEISDWSAATNAKTLSLEQYKQEVEESALQTCDARTIDNFLTVSTSNAECSISETLKVQSFSNEHLKTSVDCILATVGSIMAVQDTSSRSIQLKRLALEKAENSIDAVVNALAERCQLAGIGKGATWPDPCAEIVGFKGASSQAQGLIDAKLNSAIEGVNSGDICGIYAERTPVDGVKEYDNEVTPDKVIQHSTNPIADYNLRISSNKVDRPEIMVHCSEEQSFELELNAVNKMLCRVPLTEDELLSSDENGTTETEEKICEGSEVNQDVKSFKPEMVLNLELDTANEPTVRITADDDEPEEILDEDNLPSATFLPSHVEPLVQSNELKECKKQLQGYLEESSCSQDPILFRTDSKASEETKKIFSAVLHQDIESIPTTIDNLMPACSVEPTFASTKNELELGHVKTVDYHGKENIENDSDLNRLSLRKLKALCKEKTTVKFSEGRKTMEKEERRAVLTPVHVNIMGRGASNYLPEKYKH
ncbi:hypothetical protein O6H91_10G101200 [Diphasiastrum complanatum]|uniref:Uncharacterized protein n=1 Tax=Diphasiastrum complanatum TaxID=34168 RepID=A0ACC2CK43_DIPCM|nr:hypothetical protein O6H91_10G101200 [Diphasiastrum complanatum]